MNGTRLVTTMLVLSAAGLAANAQAPAPTTRIRQISGSAFVHVVRSDGSVIGWGREDEGFGGARPAPAPGTAVPFVLTLPGPVQQMASGADMTYALLEDGAVYAWGANDRGQFGRGPGSSQTPANPLRTATPIRMAVPNDIVQVSAAGHHALAVRRDGTVLAWGERPGPGFGPVEMALKPVAGLADVVRVAASGDHDLALTREGRVFAWGENKNGQLGVDPTETRRSATPVLVTGLEDIIDIAASGTSNFGFSGAVKRDGTVWMWGSDQSATMGDGVFWGNGGPEENHATPVMVKGVNGATAIRSGGGHVVVLLADRTVRTWGHDGWGQAGVGTSGFYQPLPKKPAITDVVAVYAVNHATFAVKADGTLWWWGASAVNNTRADLGRNRLVPTRLSLPAPESAAP